VKAIKTEYKGVQMKSRLESNIAMFLDSLGIKWVYEPKSFLLKAGFHYMPDFYLPELNMWIEGKGVITPTILEEMRCFVMEKKTELLILAAEKFYWISSKDYPEDKPTTETGFQIGFCGNCKKHFFCGPYNSYHCRSCSKHNGDHDIKWSSLYGNHPKLNLSKVGPIKQFLRLSELSIMTGG